MNNNHFAMIFCSFDALDPVAIAVKAQVSYPRALVRLQVRGEGNMLFVQALTKPVMGKQHKGIMDLFF